MADQGLRSWWRASRPSSTVIPPGVKEPGAAPGESPVPLTPWSTRVAEVAAPSGKSRLPAPRTTGKTSSRYSSMRPASCSVCTSPQLPCTWSSRPGRSFSACTAATTSVPITVVFCHVGSVSVVETTCLGRPLSLVATLLSGSVTWDQKADIMSYVVRPSRNSLASANHPSTTWPNPSST